MLTPRFELSQTDNELNIIIHAPYANIKDTVINIDGTDFRFYSTPYYLRLNLPGKIKENDASTGNYNCEKGDFNLKFSKVHKGEYFENLDMITILLAPSKKFKNVVPVVEVISNPCSTSNKKFNDEKTCDDNNEDSNNINDYENEWYTNQIPVSDNIYLLETPKYGFANKISGVFSTFEDAWIKEIIDLPSPDKTLLKDRKKLRESEEIKSFNEQHYMADFVETEYIEPYLSYECEWEKLLPEDINFNNIEKDIFKELPNKEYLLDENDIKTALYGMVDILFGNCYNCRTTLGENTVESCWTINKLSSTLSWFQNFSNMNEVIVSCMRRSLCYPLIRNWNVSIRVFQDIKKVIKLGKKYILKRFCEIFSLFNNSYEPRYILNQLYIQDYLIWLQQISNSKIEELNLLLDNINPLKDELGLNLIKIEEAICMVQNEDLIIKNELYSLPNELEKLILNNEIKSSSDHCILPLQDDSDSDSDDSSTNSTISSSTSNSSSISSSTTLDSDDNPN